MSTTTISVEGMTCGGCANSVRAELSHLPGVHDVDIDLSRGTVTIASDAPIDAAGYQLAS
jgi:copper chaperone CopZ